MTAHFKVQANTLTPENLEELKDGLLPFDPVCIIVVLGDLTVEEILELEEQDEVTLFIGLAAEGVIFHLEDHPSLEGVPTVSFDEAKEILDTV